MVSITFMVGITLMVFITFMGDTRPRVCSSVSSSGCSCVTISVSKEESKEISSSGISFHSIAEASVDAPARAFPNVFFASPSSVQREPCFPTSLRLRFLFVLPHGLLCPKATLGTLTTLCRSHAVAGFLFTK